MVASDRLPTLSATRVRLRWLTEADDDDLFGIFSNEEVTKYWSHPPFQRREQASDLRRDIHSLFVREVLFQWGIALESTDRVIGTCTLAHLDLRNQRAEIGFAMRRDQWGHGYMREALCRLLAHAFGDMGIHRIEADVDPANAASIRTLEHLGFQREGLLRERWLVGGKRQDSLFFGLLAPAWRQAQEQGE